MTQSENERSSANEALRFWKLQSVEMLDRGDNRRYASGNARRRRASRLGTSAVVLNLVLVAQSAC